MNERKAIEQLIGGLLSQSRKPDEIIIVDGGSKDGTIEIVKHYAETNNLIRLIVEEKVNIARGRNIGIKNAVHSLIAVIDAGCRPDKNWLEELILPFEKESAVDAVAGVIKMEYDNNFEFYSGKLMAGGLKEPDEDNFLILGRSAAFRKTVWEKAGGYPEWLYTAEDTLFNMKLKSIDANLRLAKDSVVYWRPRRTLWKMAKMFYLYGRGNGRIGLNVSGAHYHLRNYVIGLILIIISFYYPISLLLLIVFTGYFYKGFYRQIINRVKNTYPGWKAEAYVPLIVVIRTFSYCAGLLLGHYEYNKHASIFKENLKTYLCNPSTLRSPVPTFPDCREL